MREEDIIRFVSDGFERAKGGDAGAVYAEVAPWHDNGSLPRRSHYPFGWIIYYALHKSDPRDIDGRKRMLARYLRLQVERPHKLHSMILTEAIRLYKDTRDAAFGRRPEDAPSFSIMKFSALWDMANLRPGDWRRKEHEGKQLSATAEKLITHYVDEAENTRTAPSAQFMEVMSKALAEFPDAPNLLSQRAILHIMNGEREDAAALLRRALLASPGKFFLWSRLASVTPVDVNPRLHVALLYKALKAPGQEQFKGRVRIALAEAWVSVGNYPLALHELQRVKDFYQSSGWHLPAACRKIEEKIPAGTVAADPAAAYRSVEHLADEDLYAALPSVRCRKNYHKNPDPSADRPGYGRNLVAWRVVDAEGNTYWFQPRRFGIDENLPVGTEVDVRIHNGKAVKVTLSER